ncbi:MAG: hypothetical protein J6S00_00125, partial [Clostridia bacterium]|nr:hypothetical protein [Clostridia bacterium]
VSDGTNSKDVFLLVAATADGPFNIFEYDFANYADDVAAGKSPWKAQKFRKNGTTWVLDTLNPSWNSTQKGVALSAGSTSSVLYLTDDSVIKNFKDYTVKFTAAVENIGSWRLFGAIKATTDENTKLLTGDSQFIAPTLQSYNSAGTLMYRATNYTFKKSTKTIDFAYAAKTAYDFAYKFSGNDITISAAATGNELQQIYKLSEDSDTPAIPTGSATVGVYAEDTIAYVSKISVSVDVGESLPVATDAGIELYKIDNNAPAIPTTALRQIDLNNTILEFGAEKVLGSDVVWSTTDTGVSIKDKTLLTFKKGTYKITATYGEQTKDIYVVVKNEGEKDWVIYSTNMTEGVLPSDWTAQYWQTTTKAWTDITVAPTSLTPNPNPGLVPFNHTTPGANVRETHGMQTLKNDSVADFANYTMEVQATLYGHLDTDGTFFYGRTSTTGGKLTTDSEAYGFTVDTRKDVKNNKPYSKAKYTKYVGNAYSHTSVSSGVTDWTASAVQAGQNGSAPMRNWIVTFDGSKGTVYDAADTAENHIFTYNNIPEIKGTVGIGT